MKIAILGDTHFGASRHSGHIHDNMEKFYQFFFEYMETNNIKNLIQLGDLFDVRKHVMFQTVQWAQENFFDPIKNSGIHTIVLAGNHDCTYKNTNSLNSVSLLCPPNIRVIHDHPESVLIGDVPVDIFPWVSDSTAKETSDLIGRSKSQYAFGHFEFIGFPMYAGTDATHGGSHEEFGKYKKVFSGHYHTISIKDNVQYTGTPTELNWSDCSDPKGFWVLDTVTGLYEHIRNPYTLFVRVFYTTDMEFDFETVRDKFVRITVVQKGDSKKFESFITTIEAHSPLEYKIIDTSTVTGVTEALDVTNISSTQNMISDVIDALQIDLNKDVLKSSVLKLYSEALALNP